MNTLDFAIITDFTVCKMFNEVEEMDDTQKELYINLSDVAHSNISKKDYTDFLSAYDDNISFGEMVRDRTNKVLNENNLSFTDKRCYSYLHDGLYETLRNLF